MTAFEQYEQPQIDKEAQHNSLETRLHIVKQELEEARKEHMPVYKEVHQKVLSVHAYAVDKVIVQGGFPGREAKERITAIEYALLEQILTKIFKETHVKNVLDQTIGSSALLEDLQKQQWPVKVRFGSSFEKSTITGRYSRRGIEIVSIYTDPIFILDHLASDGFEYTVKTLHHEFIHWLQDKSRGEQHRIGKFFSLLTEPKDVSFIQELHAFLSENRLGVKIEENTVDWHIENLKKRYHLNEKDEPKIIAAFQDIKTLHALGVKEADIARVVTESRWDKKRKRWDMLAQQVSNEIQKRGISKADIQLLIEINDIQSELALYKIIKITQTAIEQFLESK